jgi:hypothetical protein
VQSWARALVLISMIVVLLPAAPAMAQDGGSTSGDGSTSSTGGAEYGVEPEVVPRETVPGDKAVLLESGYAAAPENAPLEVREAIWAANEIQDKPYRYGGGHATFDDDGYDCSGTVSYALFHAGLLKRSRDSSGFMRYGAAGKGQWITIYTNPGHAYMVIAGLRLDTSSAGARTATARGPRWRDTGRPKRGFKVRHPVGY